MALICTQDGPRPAVARVLPAQLQGLFTTLNRLYFHPFKANLKLFSDIFSLIQCSAKGFPSSEESERKRLCTSSDSSGAAASSRATTFGKVSLGQKACARRPSKK